MTVCHKYDSTFAGDCLTGACRLKCSLEVLDGLLSLPETVTGEEVDLLLDFRSLLRARHDAEATLQVFCDLRRRMELRHYLAFYRLRRWLENQVIVRLFSKEDHEVRHLPLCLDFYCVEAIRRQSVCVAIKRGMADVHPHLQFAFIQLPQHRDVQFAERDLSLVANRLD